MTLAALAAGALLAGRPHARDDLDSVGKLEIAELLLSRGADANAIAADGTTPLALASVDPEMEALIRRHGGR